MITNRLAILLILLAGPALGADLTGIAQAKDGDSLVVNGQEVRLHGIDAPEWHQPCELPGGGKWHPGQEAAAWLRSVLADHSISCKPEAHDHYRRTVATCYLDGRNLNEWLVREGWAFAYRRYSDRYVPAEAEAKAAGRGLWRGTCEQPETWRHRNADKGE